MTTSVIPIWIHGANGRVGIELQKLLGQSDNTGFSFAGGSGRTFYGITPKSSSVVTEQTLADVLGEQGVTTLLDFSSPEGNQVLFRALEIGIPKNSSILIGTTGLSPDQLEKWRLLAEGGRQHRVLVAPNTSIGILLLARAAIKIAGVAAQLGFDLEIVETHHRAKKDAPSGTANFLAETILSVSPDLKPTSTRSDQRRAGEVGIHSIRGGGVYGEHEIRILGDNEEICLSHRAFSRSLFAAGALTLTRWLTFKKPGFYKLSDVDLTEVLPK